MTYWILTADASKARLYSVTGRKAPLRLERQLEHPESRLPSQELVTDALGRFNKGGAPGTRLAISSAGTPHDHEAEHFAARLGQLLDNGARRKAFTRVAIIAPPHFLGLLRQKISKEVEARLRVLMAQDVIPLDKHAQRPHLEVLLGERDLASVSRSVNA